MGQREGLHFPDVRNVPVDPGAAQADENTQGAGAPFWTWDLGFVGGKPISFYIDTEKDIFTFWTWDLGFVGGKPISFYIDTEKDIFTF